MEAETSMFFPDTYSGFIATGSLGVAVLFLFISVFQSDKSHATKMFSIMVVVSLALFSSNVATYFAAIFIVATAVTELEFLQNLAAIIRKDENYFKYKKDHPLREEGTSKTTDEAIESDVAKNKCQISEEKIKIDLSKVKGMSQFGSMNLAYEVEEKALNYLEKEVGKIERAVGFSKGGIVAEFDGVAVNSQGKHRLVVDVKWRRIQENLFANFMFPLRRFAESVDRFTKITGEIPDRYFIFVVNEKNSLSQESENRLYSYAGKLGIEVRLVTLAEIGFDVENQ